jgi:hypothetical protein
MDEHDLCSLADEPGGPLEHRRPVTAVLHRSQQLRRRRQARRGLGAGLLIAGLLGAGAWAGASDPDPDVATAPPSPPELCWRAGYGPDETAGVPPEGSSALALHDAAGLIFLPSDVPDGLEITGTSAWRDRARCPDDPVLTLQADGGDDTLDATIKLVGPYREPLLHLIYDDRQTTAATRLRGVDATRITLSPMASFAGEDTLIAFTWTDTAGASWLLEGIDVEEATLRAVAEAAQLDASSTPPVPPADIAATDLPAGWELTWRSPARPTPGDGPPPSTTSWNLDLGSAPDGCSLWTEETTPNAPPELAAAYPGQRMITIHGQPALLFAGHTLQWIEPTGVRIKIYCGAPTDGLVAMSESLQPVDADDPRLPAG